MTKYIAHIYITLMVLYYAQDFLYSGESIVSKVLLVAIIGLSFYYWVFAIQKYKMPSPLIILSVLLIFWTVYGIPPLLFGSGVIKSVGLEPFYYIKSIYLSLLPIFPFFVFTKKGLLTEKNIRKWFFVFLVVAIGSFVSNQQSLLMALQETGRDISDVTNNLGYVMVSLLCLIPLFYRKPALMYSLMAICLYFVLTGFKRGAILVGALSAIVIVMWTLKHKEKKGNPLNKRRWRIILLVGVLIVGAVYAVQTLLQSSDYFVERIDRTMEGNSSDRDIIYSFFYKHFFEESDIFSFLFGNGAYGTVELYGKFAHNDWLEIAIDNGVFVLLLYALFWISIIRILKRGNRNSMQWLIITIFFIVFFIRTFISMSYNSISLYAACAFGFALANYDYTKTKR